MTENQNRTNRKTSFVIAAVLASILLAACIWFFTYQNDKRITGENREYLVDNATQVAESIDNAISEGYDNIKILSELVSRSLTEPEFDITSIQELIKNSVFDFMEFADKDGMDHNITGGISGAVDRQYYLDAKAGNTGMELIYVSRATHETLLMFYSPIYFEGEFVGSLVGVYQASNRISNLLDSEYFGESAQAYLATPEGRIIARNEGYDPKREMSVFDIAEGDPSLIAVLRDSLETGETVTFSLEKNTTGGCMIKLPRSGGFLIQIFPQKASNTMIFAANRLGFELAAFLIVIYAAVMFLLVRFFRSQQKEVEEARTKAEVANMAKTDFLFNISHDIRTPMNAIIGFTNMGLKYIDDKEKVKDCLSKTQQSGNLLLTLINSVLDVSRIEANQALPNETEGDVCLSFVNIESTMHELAALKDITISYEFGEIKDRYVYADFDRCIRVFTNIITNSIKYTKEGGRIWVRCEQVGEKENGKALYRYSFEDNGIGMSEEFQEHMFEAFTREQNSTISGIQGSGLGLSVCKSFVDYLGGTIECRSRQGVGTTFTITLPFRVQEGKNFIDPLTGSLVEGSGGAVETRQIDFSGRKALLVEDNELNREIARDILEEQGLVIEEAENGAVAVNVLKDKGPDYYDFVLMDIQMPVMNGYEATKLIREMYPDAVLPVIAISANAFSEDKEMSRKAGMDDHIAKPIETAELFHVLSKYL